MQSPPPPTPLLCDKVNLLAVILTEGDRFHDSGFFFSGCIRRSWVNFLLRLLPLVCFRLLLVLVFYPMRYPLEEGEV